MGFATQLSFGQAKALVLGVGEHFGKVEKGFPSAKEIEMV